jgi:hypothetical protein
LSAVFPSSTPANKSPLLLILFNIVPMVKAAGSSLELISFQLRGVDTDGR